MERTSIVVPNVRLKRQRELKGWTQEQLAGFVETTTANISRWENGKIPGPHFRSQLCTLFNKTPQELGWFDEHTEMAVSPVEHIADEPMALWPFTITSDEYYPLPGREKDIQQLLDVLHNPQGASMLVSA